MSYKHYGDWVTTCWLKQVWEKVDRYGFILTVHNLLLSFPREDDNWLMARFIAMGYEGEELMTLNRVRKHQQVLFLSDILGASGGSLDKWHLEMRRVGERWSSIKFPCEAVNELEMGLWRRATAQVVARGPAQASLGRLKIGGINSGSGGCRRAKAVSTPSIRTGRWCTSTSGGVDMCVTE